jgi:hypothetical protein
VEAWISFRRLEASLEQDARVIEVDRGVVAVRSQIEVDGRGHGHPTGPGLRCSNGTVIDARFPRLRPRMGSNAKILRGRRSGCSISNASLSAADMGFQSFGIVSSDRASITLP